MSDPKKPMPRAEKLHMLKILQAHLDGKTIEWKNDSGDWEDYRWDAIGPNEKRSRFRVKEENNHQPKE